MPGIVLDLCFLNLGVHQDSPGGLAKAPVSDSVSLGGLRICFLVRSQMMFLLLSWAHPLKTIVLSSWHTSAHGIANG